MLTCKKKTDKRGMKLASSSLFWKYDDELNMQPKKPKNRVYQLFARIK